MSGYTVTSTRGNVRASETEHLFVPTVQRPGKLGIVLLHGATGSTQYMDPARLHSMRFAAYLATSGVPVIAAEMAGDSFANDNSQTAVTNAINYMSAQTGVPNDRAILIGGSMGAAVGIRYASQNPTKVACFVGFIPCCNINTLYQANTLGLRATIGTAWGVTYPTALPANARIENLATAMKNVVPSRLYYSLSDAAIPPADVEAMVAIAGSEIIAYDPAATGHTEPTIGAYVDKYRGYQSEIIDYIRQYGA